MPAWMLDAAERLAGLYSLPETTGLRVMAMAYHAAGSGGADADPLLLAVSLGEAYGCAQAADFITDVTGIYHAAATGTLR